MKENKPEDINQELSVIISATNTSGNEKRDYILELFQQQTQALHEELRASNKMVVKLDDEALRYMEKINSLSQIHDALLKQLEIKEKEMLFYAVTVLPEKDAEYERLQNKQDELKEVADQMAKCLLNYKYYFEGKDGYDEESIIEASQEVLESYNKLINNK